METVNEAGAVVYRIIGNKIEFLIQHSKKDPSSWIFPKGHIELLESPEQAATRELLEEAGVIGKCKAFIDNVVISRKNKFYSIDYFLHEYISTENSGEKGRDPVWVKTDEALEKLSHEEARALLTKASRMLSDII